MLCQLRARRVYRRDGSVAGQRHANGFAQAGHAVGRIHARAAAAAGTGVFGVIVQHVFADDAGLVAPQDVYKRQMVYSWMLFLAI